MSLAEDLRRPFESVATPATSARQQQRRVAVEAPRVVATTGKDVRELRKAEPALVAPDTTGESLSLLDRAAKSVVFLLGRYRQLEEHVRQLDAWSKAQIQAAEAAASRWQDASAESERKVQDLQRSLEVMTRRAETAEQALKRDRDTLGVLQDRIIAAFGFGSEAHDALAALEAE